MYYLSILAIMKNEAMNLRIWIDHYLWQGVDHIYLIDNGCTDETIEILKELIHVKGYPITLYILHKPHAQREHYAYVYNQENLQECTKWLIVADLDEFFYCKDSTVRTELVRYEEKHEKNGNGTTLPKVIGSQWRMFGSEGLVKHPLDIRTAITHRVPGFNINGKYIFQTKGIPGEALGIHGLTTHTTIQESDLFRCNHYPIQSREYFEKVKMTRGDAVNAGCDHVRNWQYFDRYDRDMTCHDTDLKNMVLG